MIKADDILKISRSRIGKMENPPNSNNIDCNTWYYGHPVNGSAYPWCVVEIEYVFHLANASHLISRTASASTLAQWFKNNKRFVQTPQKGDIVFFNFHTPGKLADHVGIVESVNVDGTIFTIEGNTSATNKGSQDNGGIVARKRRNSKIVGYGRPNYDSSVEPSKQRKTLRFGDIGEDVLYLQQSLRKLKYGCPDNAIFERITELCVINFQTVKGLDADGIVGKNTWNELDKAMASLN